MLCNKEVKVMKTCTIILIWLMTLAVKVLATFTFDIGTFIFKSPYGTDDYTVVTHSGHINVHGDENKMGILQANNDVLEISSLGNASPRKKFVAPNLVV